MHSPRPPAPPAMSPAIAVALAGCALLIIGALLWKNFGPSPEPQWAHEDAAQIQSGLDFPSLNIDAEELQRARQVHDEAPELSRELRAQHQALIEAIKEANRAQFTDAEPIDARSLQARIDDVSAALVPATGPRGFVPLGSPLFEACATSLEELLAALRRGAITLDEASTAPALPRFASYREHCGNVIPMLRQHNLITNNALWQTPSSPLIFDILQRYRFAEIIHTIQPTRLQLAPYEYEMLTRWRIEDAEAFDVRTRRRFLSRVSTIIPDYDVNLAHARLDVHGRSPAEAIPRFQQLVSEHPDSARYRDILTELRRSAGLPARSTTSPGTP
ncbi:hypothetical protein EA187_05465 [Lujinxingia sediminis]|uniref:Tetratricopeptide repeat protein n=1 Tax=Lujinxingia sediminis TaxID=2480984 RepID=A0ABY0CYC1_9DELT|nr:hypothetical protein [Lujinxingia sediminis]RVU48877.1 hypothetical protein EA187_05465 [Lujinxingia sediminis]